MRKIRGLPATLLLALASLASLAQAFIIKSSSSHNKAPTPTDYHSRRLYYSSGLEDFLGSPEFNSTIPGDDAVLEAYDNWRIEYNKGDYRQDRFENFKVNYKTLMAANAASMRRARQKGTADPAPIMSLNEYGDCSIAEYKSILNSLDQSHHDVMINVEDLPLGSSDEKPTSSNERQIEQSKDETILRAYVDWCKTHGKEFDESRLPVFTEHYLNAEKYFNQVGKPVKLNKYADLTVGEYDQLMRSDETPGTETLTSTPSLVPESSLSAGSYLESIARGKTTSTYFGEKKELNGEALSDLYTSMNGGGLHEEAKAGARVVNVEALEEYDEEENAPGGNRQESLEEERLRAWEEARRKAEEEAKQKAAEAMNRNQQSQGQREEGSLSAPFRPLTGSYMGAVAKTWESRSEYLAKLQASNEYLNSMNDKDEADLSTPSDNLDYRTGNFPTTAGSQTGPPTLNSVGNTWEDDDDIEETNKELAQVREAAKLLERRREDERAAKRAREEAEEWMRVQKKLEEQADLARERREREERAIEEAQRRARELEAANLERERMLKEVQAIEAQRKADEKARTERVKQLRETKEQDVKIAQRKAASLEGGTKSNSFFSMFQPKKAEHESSSWLPFSFSDNGKDDQSGGIKEKESQSEKIEKGAAPVDAPKPKSPFSFFIGNAESPSEPQQSLAPESQESATGFSFFQRNTNVDKERAEKMAAYERNQQTRKERSVKAEQQRSKLLEEIAKKSPQTGFVPSWLQKEKRPQPDGTPVPTISLWSQNDDGTIAGVIENSNNFNSGVRITTSPVLGKVRAGTIITTVSGSRYKLGEAEKSTGGGETASELLQKTIQFFGKKREVALLSDWQANADNTVTGKVRKKKGFNDGAKITTSPVLGEIRAGKVVQTRGGSFYRLL
eukprot:scaffold42_cov133-Cylindrotheca_fusiformis.AAC.8